MYCDKIQVKLVASKIKLLVFTTKQLVFTTKQTEMQAVVDLAVNTITVDCQEITPSHGATHVGVVRCGEGNGPNIAARVSVNRSAMYSVVSAGLAKGHRANPAAWLRVEEIYCITFLLSGLGCLVLTGKEEKMLEQHYIKCTFRGY